MACSVNCAYGTKLNPLESMSCCALESWYDDICYASFHLSLKQLLECRTECLYLSLCVLFLLFL